MTLTKTTEVFDKWEYWIQEKKLMGQDQVLVEVAGTNYELHTLSRAAQTVSYIDTEGKIITVPASKCEHILVDEEFATPLTLQPGK